MLLQPVKYIAVGQVLTPHYIDRAGPPSGDSRLLEQFLLDSPIGFYNLLYCYPSGACRQLSPLSGWYSRISGHDVMQLPLAGTPGQKDSYE